MGFTLKPDEKKSIYNPKAWHMIKDSEAMLKSYIDRVRTIRFDISRILTKYCMLSTEDQKEARDFLIDQVTKRYQKIVDVYFRANANVYLMGKLNNKISSYHVDRLEKKVRESMQVFVLETNFLSHDFIFSRPSFRTTVALEPTTEEKQSISA